MPTRTEAIKAFLQARTHRDLAAMYNHDMECQVIVAQGKGEKIEGEYAGSKWAGYTDGVTTWKPFRIPRNAYAEPVYDDQPMTFDLGIHCEGIGMTGWDWKNRKSLWVAYDFDAIMGHSDKHQSKIDNDELERVREEACKIPWVTVRYSTSGQGLHLYVMLADYISDHRYSGGIPTINHTEHAALARAILAKMSVLTGFDFQARVDICGGNMWVYHRKMINTNGLKIIKSGVPLSEIEANWRDHVPVVEGKRKKIRHKIPGSDLMPDLEDKFDQLSGQHNKIKLDPEHLRLIKYLQENNLFYWWDADRHMLVTHTIHLAKAHDELNMRGIFKTNSKGENPNDQNCFCFPMRRGSWSVRRYGRGTLEDVSWEPDAQGWTRCFLNYVPTLRTASIANQGLEDPSGGFVFSSGTEATEAALAVGADVQIPAGYDSRRTTIKTHKDNKRIIVEMPRESLDDSTKLPGWLPKGNKWIKMFNATLTSQNDVDYDAYDDVVRHLVTPDNQNAEWVINSEGHWNDEPLTHIKHALESMGLKPGDIKQILGGNIFKPWRIVNRPFQPEYPGDRQWNRFSPQLRHVPSKNDELHYPTWKSVLNHIGKSLDSDLQANTWAKASGVKTGADYLMLWIASMIQYPLEPLPYLFIYSDRQGTGKSILHEALSLLFKPGYQRADQALVQASAFNGELEGAILCVVEETDLSSNKTAYNRIKDWVTSRVLPIHKKFATPYHVDNSTHWIQCANSRNYCPVFPGDTRITYINVPELPENPINKRELLRLLDKEAPEFLGAIMRVEIPVTNDRLNIPVIETSDKVQASEANRTALEEFIDQKCYYAPGEVVLFSEFYEKFKAWLDPAERFNWATKMKVSQKMPDKFVKGRLSTNPNIHWGNISFEPPKSPDAKPLVCVGGFLRQKE